MNTLTRIDHWLKKGVDNAHPVLVISLAVLVLLALNIARVALRARAWQGEAAVKALSAMVEESAQGLAVNQSLRDLKAKDLSRFKVNLSTLTSSRREIYEGGLQLQSERRILEKQWEIMSTFLLIDEEIGKVHLMRMEQSLESYRLGYVPVQVFGIEPRPLPVAAVIISKERFAHPERPKSEEVDGQLEWEPPQVGNSARANALGEFVMFTRGPLIIHGPPRSPEEHEAFPHYCLGLDIKTARRLYNNSYIGTRVLIRRPGIAPPSTSQSAKAKL
ncbi:MAG: L,D-transpeptidase [Elusimicrobia bacterium]|nr:L,D-transpeptidase [Elusimicrobiota bacterium]